MPLIVEDGTGVVGANSYCSVAFADDYFSMAGNGTWATFTQPQKESALFQASQYIDLAWGSIFPGSKWKEDQGLQWPRKVCCTDTVPTFPNALLTACCEYAVRAAVAPLAPDPEFDETGRIATLKKEKVGPLEEETRWNIPTGQMPVLLFRPMPIPDAMMRSFLPQTAAVGRVVH